jgi:hypothetical protein
MMSREFVSGEIPLAEPSDIRFKIARLSAATAARLFSTDKTGEKVVIEGEHVLFAVDHMMKCYKDHHFGYHSWSRQKKSRAPDDDVMAKHRAGLTSIACWQRIRPILQEEEIFTAKDLMEMGDLDQDGVTKLIYELRSRQVITKTQRGYRKTPIGIALLRHT